MKNCSECQFAIMQDFGYSNYTVEGTTFICSKGLHPDGSFDRFYGEDPKLAYAEECAGHEQGAPADLDVDGEWRDDEAIQQHPAIKIIKARELISGESVL